MSTKSSTSGKGWADITNTAFRSGVGHFWVGRERPARKRIRRTRQSLPPLKEMASSSRLEVGVSGC